MDNKIILLFGMPRSGTTWLGKIFDSHPETLYRHEPDSVARLTWLPLLPESCTEEQFSRLRHYATDMVANRELKVVGKAPVFDKSYFTSIDLLRYKSGIAASRVIGRLGFSLPVLGTPNISAGRIRLVWKSIESLGRLGLILQTMPEARALHIIRHPCGYIASVKRGEERSRFGDLVPASEDYTLFEMLLQTRVGQSWGYSMSDIRDMNPEERLAWRWAVFNDKALADTEGNSRAFAFAYERLCTDPLSVAQRLLAHAGLDLVPQVERFLRASIENADTSYYSVFKNPAKSAVSWKQALDSATVRRIVALASRSAAWNRLGYEHMEAVG